MTTAVYDGKVLAADRLSTASGTRWGVSPKIRKLPGGGYFVGAGDIEAIEQVFCWIKAGMSPSDKPELKDDEGFEAIVVGMDGSARFVGQRLVPCNAVPPVAIGSGRDFALAAILCGRSAKGAVEIAALLDTSTGGGVDSVRIKGAKHGSK